MHELFARIRWTSGREPSLSGKLTLIFIYGRCPRRFRLSRVGAVLIPIGVTVPLVRPKYPVGEVMNI